MYLTLWNPNGLSQEKLNWLTDRLPGWPAPSVFAFAESHMAPINKLPPNWQIYRNPSRHHGVALISHKSLNPTILFKDDEFRVLLFSIEGPFGLLTIFLGYWPATSKLDRKEFSQKHKRSLIESRHYPRRLQLLSGLGFSVQLDQQSWTRWPQENPQEFSRPRGLCSSWPRRPLYQSPRRRRIPDRPGPCETTCTPALCQQHAFPSKGKPLPCCFRTEISSPPPARLETQSIPLHLAPPTERAEGRTLGAHGGG